MYYIHIYICSLQYIDSMETKKQKKRHQSTRDCNTSQDAEISKPSSTPLYTVAAAATQAIFRNIYVGKQQ